MVLRITILGIILGIGGVSVWYLSAKDKKEQGTQNPVSLEDKRTGNLAVGIDTKSDAGTGDPTAGGPEHDLSNLVNRVHPGEAGRPNIMVGNPFIKRSGVVEEIPADSKEILEKHKTLIPSPGVITERSQIVTLEYNRESVKPKGKAEIKEVGFRALRGVAGEKIIYAIKDTSGNLLYIGEIGIRPLVCTNPECKTDDPQHKISDQIIQHTAEMQMKIPYFESASSIHIVEPKEGRFLLKAPLN